MIESARGKRRKQYLLLSIIANVGVLCVFKYFNFFIDNVNGLLHAIHISSAPIPFLHIILPLGLSFHTFQAMSYTIEVYRGNQKAERHLGIYALYVMFYPQLVAGPIERPQNLLHQFREKHYFDYDNAVTGLRLMLWGMFKKVVIADKLALFVDPVFNNPSHYPPLTILIAVLFFTFEIYCDFSGYSDIAIGAARFMGFTLMTNFNRPYFSTSISNFWKRWHISLSTWFRDYLYISLGGNRVKVKRWYFNLFVVFLVSGFWHGANWTFVLWGALHGFYLIFAIVSEKTRNKLGDKLSLNRVTWLKNLLNVLVTFGLTSFAWIFFRAKNVSTAFYIIKRLPYSIKDLAHFIITSDSWLGSAIPVNKLAVSFIVIAILLVIEFLQGKVNLYDVFKRQPVYIRWSAYFAILITMFLYGEFGDRTFIYFQF
jgi:alginate O-acetyltransferase complex protein AlgI